MRVRKLDKNGDYSFGHGVDDFWINIPDGVSQIIRTRLALWKSQWWLDTTRGTDWNLKVLGKYTGSLRDVTIQNRILTTPGVQGIAAYASQIDRGTRKWSVQARIDTDYGQALIQGPI